MASLLVILLMSQTLLVMSSKLVFGYVAYSVSYDTAGGTISATYIDGRDDDIVDVDESLVFAYGISL